MQKIIKTAVIAAIVAASTTQAAKLTDRTFTLPVGHTSYWLEVTDSTGDDPFGSTPTYGIGVVYLTEADAPEFWSYITNGTLEWAGWWSDGNGRFQIESRWFWDDVNADPVDLFGSGVTYLRLDYDGTVLNVQAHDGAVPSVPDGGSTAVLATLALGALGVARRHSI